MPLDPHAVSSSPSGFLAPSEVDAEILRFRHQQRIDASNQSGTGQYMHFPVSCNDYTLNGCEQMITERFAVPALLALVALTVSSCERAGTIAGGGVGNDYSVARQALETGNYSLAIRRYESLLTRVSSGSAARLQLEYAHSLLRADRFSEAIQATEALVHRPDDSILGLALAVRGTARHELARQMLEKGERDERARQLLEGARDDLAHFLGRHNALDSGGSMRARSQLVLSDLGQVS